MNYVLAGGQYAFDFQSDTGLAGVAGVQVFAVGGIPSGPRSTAGIVEAPAGSGNYVGVLTAPAVPGQYVAVIDDGAAVPNHVSSSAFQVVGAPVLVPPPSSGSVPGPILGPCQSWISGDDVKACCRQLGSPVDEAALAMAALEASMALYEISGRLFPGLCGPRTVRPCYDPCRCWSYGQGSWAWSWSWGLSGSLSSGWWWNECGDRCGCGTTERVKLAGYPVREILEVKVDGAAVDPATYRLDEWRWLTVLDDPGPPAVKRYWPRCQNLSLPDTEAGTFSVAYRWGVDPPPLGLDAAAEVACQLYAACKGAKCELPKGTTKVVRQGVEVQRAVLMNWLDPTKTTGLVHVDLFLKAYGGRGRRRAALWSPDVQQFARRVG